MLRYAISATYAIAQGNPGSTSFDLVADDMERAATSAYRRVNRRGRSKIDIRVNLREAQSRE